MSAQSHSLGFLGLGAMGSGMASRLLDQGFSVALWNRSPGAVAPFEAREHASVCPSPAAAFEAGTVVHSMLADDAALLAVFDDELLAQVPAGRVHVNHATISPTAARELAQRHERHGVGYVQAPVLGRSTIAASGGLLVVASGGSEALALARPSLDALGQRTWELGADVAMAAIVKIAVNYSLISAMQSIAESVSLVESSGIDSTEFVEILTHTAFSGAVHKGYGPMIAEKRYEPVGFAMDLGLKDLGLAEDAAAERGVSLPISAVLHDVFEAAVADPRLSALDWAAVAEITRQRSGL
jgi:3-hydroxyisobutyrate dehydrogenase-like beta-hydroxyacid dehydrogenase